MKQRNSSRLIFFLVSLASAILVVFAVFFIRGENGRRKADTEFQVFRIMTGIVERWNMEGSFDISQRKDIVGFGVYSSAGLPLFRFGSAPVWLDWRNGMQNGVLSRRTASSMTMIRRIGGIPEMPGGDMKNPMADRPLPLPDMSGPDAGMPRRMMGDRETEYAFIEVNIGSFLTEGRLVIAAVMLSLFIFFGIIALVIVFALKLQQYRTRERESETLVQLGGAARTLVHEIKNPLGVIRVQCATLRRTVGERQLGNIDVIEEETARLVSLADRIREFLRTSAGTPQYCRAGDFLDQCGGRYGERLLVVPPLPDAGSAVVYIDPGRMTQILDNIIVNALDATGPGDPSPELSVWIQRSTVFFRVSDSGPGVDQCDRDRLFEPFFTTKAKGSGIGLSLARRFAEQAGGSLNYAPGAIRGSTFTLALPLTGEGKND